MLTFYQIAGINKANGYKVDNMPCVHYIYLSEVGVATHPLAIILGASHPVFLYPKL
jgi:hypothetical protein